MSILNLSTNDVVRPVLTVPDQTHLTLQRSFIIYNITVLVEVCLPLSVLAEVVISSVYIKPVLAEVAISSAYGVDPLFPTISSFILACLRQHSLG